MWVAVLLSVSFRVAKWQGRWPYEQPEGSRVQPIRSFVALSGVIRAFRQIHPSQVIANTCRMHEIYITSTVVSADKYSKITNGGHASMYVR